MKHKCRVISKKEILANRCNAYKFIDFDKKEKTKDDFAIEILEYYHNGLFFIPLKKGEAKKIVEHIKKEKNL